VWIRKDRGKLFYLTPLSIPLVIYLLTMQRRQERLLFFPLYILLIKYLLDSVEYDISSEPGSPSSVLIGQNFAKAASLLSCKREVSLIGPAIPLTAGTV